MSTSRDELDEFADELLDLLDDGVAAVVEPSRDLRARLLERVAGPDRFLPFVDRIMELFDLPESVSMGHLAAISRSDAWDELLEGVRYVDFDAGPRHPLAHGGLVRVEPGRMFPHHIHVGEERVIVLQGTAMDELGHRYRAGDWIISDDGSAHALTSVGDEPLVFAALVISLQFGVEA